MVFSTLESLLQHGIVCTFSRALERSLQIGAHACALNFTPNAGLLSSFGDVLAFDPISRWVCLTAGVTPSGKGNTPMKRKRCRMD